jgi:DNA adenine methylase
MKYMGSKKRIAKYILPILLNARHENQWVVEPFVGGANLTEMVTGNRIGSDVNEYLIEALKLIRDNYHLLPQKDTNGKEMIYNLMKTFSPVSSIGKGMKGYYGFALSYGGKWFGGWRRDSTGKRDYVNEAYRSVVAQSPKINNVELICSDFRNLNIPSNSIIYCDPPYKNTTKYSKNFPHDDFYVWCRNKSNDGHTVFVSEYNMPKDFVGVWEMEIKSSLTKNTGGKIGIERLFVLK